MSETVSIPRIAGRALRNGSVFLSAAVLFLCTALSGPVPAEFDSSGWKWFRDVNLAASLPEGLVGVPLDSVVLEKCRPDLVDVRLVTLAGEVVPTALVGTAIEDNPEMLPVRVYRVSRKAGRWTDIWVDKNAKVLTRGILIQTRSRNFVQKTEVFGADSSQESFVIRVDGLVADVASPLPIRSLSVFHPLNNFRYLNVRIIDGEGTPLKVEGVACYPSSPREALSRHLSLRIVENRQDTVRGMTVVVADLREQHLPLTGLTVTTPVDDFSKKVSVFASSTLPATTWEPVGEDMIFRLRRDHSVAEKREVRTDKPLSKRYIKVELSGGKPERFPIDKIEGTAGLILLVFTHRPGTRYRLYYGKPSAKSTTYSGMPTSFNIAQVAATSSEVSLGEDTKNVVVNQPKVRNQPQKAAPSLFTKALGVSMLLIGLLLLFSIMLRSRSARRQGRRSRSHIMNPRTR